MKRLVSLLVAAAMLLVAFSAVAEEISGPLVLYSSMTDNDIDNLIEAFNEVYPNVEVEVVNGSAGELAARIRAERTTPRATCSGADCPPRTAMPTTIFLPNTSPPMKQISPTPTSRITGGTIRIT